MLRKVSRMVRFALLIGMMAALTATALTALSARDQPDSPEHLPADHIGNAADFLQTPVYKNLLTWYAQKTPSFVALAPKPNPDTPLAAADTPAPLSAPAGNPSAGTVVEVSTTAEFLAACQAPKPDTVILLADGRYDIPDIVNIRHVKNLTVRGKSGDRSKVILDGAKSQNERILWVEDCDGFAIADLTIQNCLKYGLTFDANTSTQNVRVYNVHFHNCWQRGLKITGLLEARRGYRPTQTLDDRTRRLRPHNGRVEYCLFTVDHPKRFDDGVDHGDYIAGIDAMWLKDWVIADNVFIGIQGWHVGGRGAVFVWVKSEDVTVERNLFIGCDRSIAFGNPSGADEHMVRGVIRHNFIVVGAYKGIELCRTRDCAIYNNTVYDPSADCSRVIHVMEPVGKVAIVNNLVRGTILVDGGETQIDHNLLSPLDCLQAPAHGNLHLAWLQPGNPAWPAVAFPPMPAAQKQPPATMTDFDGVAIPAGALIGADQPAGELPPPPLIRPLAPADLRSPAVLAVRADIAAACVALLSVPQPKQAFLRTTLGREGYPLRLTAADLQAGLTFDVAGKAQAIAWNDLTNLDLALVLEMLTDHKQKDAARHYILLAHLYTYARRPLKAADMVQRAIEADKALAGSLPQAIAALQVE